MITVKLLGGAKRSFSSDRLCIDKNSISVRDLLDFLQDSVQEGMHPFEPRNVLVAINGADSSALHGDETVVKDGDVVSIIPVIHGGGRDFFKISSHVVELLRIGETHVDAVRFLESLRAEFPSLVIQGVRTKYILSQQHARRIIEVSLAADKAGTLQSNKIETDVLLRFALTRQIGEAINKAGRKNCQDFFLIVIGKKGLLDKLFSQVAHATKPMSPFPKNASFIKKEFAITRKELDCVLSKEPLEDLLVERSGILLN